MKDENGNQLIRRCAWCKTPRIPTVFYTDGICAKHLAQQQALYYSTKKQPVIKLAVLV